ncbi:unnamed protein product [Urochloa humidicola]
MDGGDSDGNASPMADGEQPHPPVPVLADAEAESSSTEPCPYRDMVELYRALIHLRLRHLSASRRRFPTLRRRRELPGGYVVVMVGIVREGILTWYVNGQPVADDDDAYVNGRFGGVPASEDAMAALPEMTVGEGEAWREECAVCLDPYEAGDTLRTMPCSHGFHESCIFQWLRVSRLCPLCRFALPAEVEEEAESFMDEEDDDDYDRGGDDILESVQFLYL